MASKIRLVLVLALFMVEASKQAAIDQPWVEILSPRPAQLFIEGEFSSILLHFVVHGVELSADSVVAHVFVIRNAISYGGDAFRGRDELRNSPHQVLMEKENKLQLDHSWLDLGLHQVRIHLYDVAQGREIAESACFFEIRLPVVPEEKECLVPDDVMAHAFEDRLEERWAQAEEEDVANVFQQYSLLHHDILHGKVPEDQRRFLILNQQAGGLGNRLGSILSGLLFAILSKRAMLVFWDVASYLQNGDVEEGGIRWNFRHEEEIKELIGDEAVQGIHYTDMGELSEYLVCSRYDQSDEISQDVSTLTTIRITNPHYYIPLIMSNPFYRRKLLNVFGARPAHILFNYLFKLAPYLQAKVDAAKAGWKGKHMIGLQIRQARSCGKMTLEGDLGDRVYTHAYMTLEHERLFYSCAISLRRGFRGNASFFLATDLPVETRKDAISHLGEDNLFYTQLPDEDVHATRAAMEEGRTTNFDGAFMDIWLLSECDDIITTPASSFGYMASARSGKAPMTVTKWGKCFRAITGEPFSHAWLLVKTVSCFDRRMLVPEFDMLCQDCVVLQCPCGDLTCASHSEPPHPLFPRQVAQVPG